MINKVIHIIVFISAFQAYSQNRNDDNWVFGRLGNGILLNFADDSLHVVYIPQMSMKTVEANVTLSDSIGNLLFYTNNCFVANAQHQNMENGGDLNPGPIQMYYCPTTGDPVQQSVIGLPSPAQRNIYYLFHVDLQIINFGQPGGADTAPLNFFVTTIDMNENNGLGKVVNKNEVVIADTLAWSSLTAVRHANGRDWWLICAEYKSNCYYKILIDPAGIHLRDKQCLGSIWNKYDIDGAVHFTPDGNKYVRSNSGNGLNIFDFDRCTGLLSNPLHISLAPDSNKISCMEISPNSRFVYVNFLSKIFQFDLWALDIASSKTLVATYDGMISSGNTTDFYISKLAPDGKIYICSFGPTYYLHTINKPDSAGVACEVLQHNILLPYTHFASMPNGPNFRLGAQSGPCDTLSVTSAEPPKKTMFASLAPNPFESYIRITKIEMQRNIYFLLYNNLGQVVKNRYLETEITNITTTDLLPGIYHWTIFSSSGRLINTGTLLKVAN